MEYKILSHADKAQRRELFALIGEYFASAAIRRDLGRPMSSDDSYTWIIAMDGDTVAGFSAIRLYKDMVAELVHAYTMPDYRGQGINKAMVDLRMEVAKQLGAKSVHTTIDPNRLSKYPGFAPKTTKGKWLVIRKVL